MHKNNEGWLAALADVWLLTGSVPVHVHTALRQRDVSGLSTFDLALAQSRLEAQASRLWMDVLTWEARAALGEDAAAAITVARSRRDWLLALVAEITATRGG